MTAITVTAKVGADGVLHLDVPLGEAEAGSEVQVVVQPLPRPPVARGVEGVRRTHGRSVERRVRATAAGGYRGTRCIMTLTITLDEAEVDSLRHEASGAGKSVEELASAVVQQHVLARQGRPAVASDEAFQKALKDTFDENAELYRRLAQ